MSNSTLRRRKSSSRRAICSSGVGCGSRWTTLFEFCSRSRARRAYWFSRIGTALNPPGAAPTRPTFENRFLTQGVSTTLRMKAEGGRMKGRQQELREAGKDEVKTAFLHPSAFILSLRRPLDDLAAFGRGGGLRGGRLLGLSRRGLRFGGARVAARSVRARAGVARRVVAAGR